MDSLGNPVRFTADIRLPVVTRDSFIDLYPLLPYHIDLIIQVVSGLRTQGGASRHVGGANRTIIKLAQQLLINPAVSLATADLGALARLDQVYDLVEGNIGSEVRAKIAAIANEVDHPLAQAVAKAICLLQYVRSVHRTAENIAAVLHPSVAADSQLASVKEALRALEAAQKVRRGDDGYRIPTPAEDDWERVRNSISPKPGDAHRLYSETLISFWQPQPSHVLAETRTFKAGLAIKGREVAGGDLVFNLDLADEGKAFQELAAQGRTRSQQERKAVFWAVPLSDAIDRETVELFRSKEVLARKEREARTADEKALINEEHVRLRRHQDELRRLLKQACLAGGVYFRGNDRSPGGNVTEVGKAASEILRDVLPNVFDRFEEAAAKAGDVKKGVDALFTADNLQGLPAVFTSFGLLRDEHGRAVFSTEQGVLAEVMRRIEERANYGETVSGRWLGDEFAKEPFGWDFDVVRLLVLSLLRAGKLEATSKGHTFDSTTGMESRDTFGNNNVFKQASFHPKKGLEFEDLVRVATAFRETFGAEVRELAASSIVGELRTELAQREDVVSGAISTLTAHHLPGVAFLQAALDQMKAIGRGSESAALATFSASHLSIKDAVKRATEVEQALTEPRLLDLDRARRVLGTQWPFLSGEAEVPDTVRESAASLEDRLARETFYRELPATDQEAAAVAAEYERRHQQALQERVDAYVVALEQLERTPGWESLDPDQQERIEAPLRRGTVADSGVPIPQLRADRDACEGRLRAAIDEVRRTIDGERLASVNLSSYFGAGIETEEQLDAAIAGIREECARLIGAGKKVVVR